MFILHSKLDKLEMKKLAVDKKIILFDGVCNLCSSAVQFIIENDKKDIFRFVSLQSDLGQEITTYLGISSADLDSIILYLPGYAYYYKSQAVFDFSGYTKEEIAEKGWLSIVHDDENEENIR